MATTSHDSMDDESPAIVRGAGGSWREFFPDPRILWMVLRRNLRLFLLVAALIVAAVAIWTLRQVPSYSAASGILVQPKADTVVNVVQVAADLPSTTDIVDTEVRLMQSPALALRVAGSYAQRHPDPATAGASGRQELANDLSDMVEIARSGATYVIDVTARSNDPQEAAEVANLYAEEFVAADKEAKVGANSAANSWLQLRVQQLERNATSADAALQQYKIAHGLISTTGSTMAEQELSSINQLISQAQADLAEKQGRLDAARAQLAQGSGGADVGAALGSGTIGTLRSREAEASSQVAQLESRYGPLYPDLLKAKSELADVRAQIQLEIDRILSNLDAEVRVAASRLSSLQASRGRSTGVLQSNNSAAVGLAELQRRSDAAKAIYETFLRRARETSAQQGLQQADTRVAQIAKPPEEPDFPNRRLAALFGVLGGLAGGLIAIGIAEYLQGGIRTKADVERRLRVRYAGAVPTLASTLGKLKATEAPHDYIVAHPFSNFSEAFRGLRAFLLLGGGPVAGAARAVAIVSPLPQEGKTTTAVCLARASAMGGTPTVLVDADLRRRGSSELLGLGGTDGLHDYMAGRCSLEEALVQDEATGLYLLGTAGPQSSAHDPLTSENMARLIADLRQRFEVIIIDTAPILGVADARVVAASVDRVLVITRWRKTSVRACEATIDILLDSGAKISGIALTQVDITRYASTGHTDTYSYQKNFKGYYHN